MRHHVWRGTASRHLIPYGTHQELVPCPIQATLPFPAAKGPQIGLTVLREYPENTIVRLEADQWQLLLPPEKIPSPSHSTLAGNPHDPNRHWTPFAIDSRERLKVGTIVYPSGDDWKLLKPGSVSPIPVLKFGTDGRHEVLQRAPKRCNIRYGR